MKKLFHFSFLILLLSACQNPPEKAPASDAPGINENVGAAKMLELPYTAVYNEKTQKLELHHNVLASKLTIGETIEAINLKYPEVDLQLVRVNDHTAHVKIADATYLTERLGSTGPETYLAEATYALTEITGISTAAFDFQEGSHASPGKYTRASFKF